MVADLRHMVGNRVHQTYSGYSIDLVDSIQIARNLSNFQDAIVSTE